MTHDPREPDNRTFEQDLDSLQSAWDRMEQDGPPDLLDQAVLNAARRDLEPKRKPRPLRWIGGFATAAVAVLAFTVFLEQETQLPIVPLQEAKEAPRMDSVAPTKERARSPALQQALPPAEPEALRREAKREKQDLGAARNVEEREIPEAGAKSLEKQAESFKLAAPAAADSEHLASVMSEEMADAPDPEAWIQRMLELQEAGDSELLANELAAFREVFPDYSLPAELAVSEP